MDWDLYSATPKWVASFVGKNGVFGYLEFELTEPHSVVPSRELWLLAQDHLLEQQGAVVLMGLTPLTLMHTNPKLK